MPEGQIWKALSGYYYVKEKKKELIWECRARGVFRKKKIHPLVGDYVQFQPASETSGTITHIKPRYSELIRPPIANVDQAFLMFSVDQPVLSTSMLDRLLVHVEKAKVRPTVCITKVDLKNIDHDDLSNQWKTQDEVFAVEWERLRMYERIGYTVLKISSKSGKGLTSVPEHLRNQTTVVTGPSGVGKSSLINRLLPDERLETSEISHKLKRGRHTTRHVELIPLPQGGLLADTPGFSQLNFRDILPEELGLFFREFRTYIPQCKFRSCLHQHEPCCAVKQAYQNGDIAAHRYQHYLLFLKEIQQTSPRKR